ncbi:MAG: arginine--tRNA ligase [Ignavibacteriales bacterium]
MKNYLQNLFAELENKISYLKNEEIILTYSKSGSHGDISTNIAMQLAKKIKKNPKLIAQEIVDNINTSDGVIEKIEIAGNGFINFYFSQSFITEIIKTISREDEKFGKSEKYKGKKAQVEFVSANPTGPLTVGHGRNAVIGDTVANMLEFIGYDVSREYYFNDAGRQMRVLGDSVRLRYLQLLNHQIDFPEDYYQGEYIKDIAKELLNEFGEQIIKEDAESIFKQKAEEVIFNDIKKTLSRLEIKMDEFYNEHSLYTEGRIDGLLKAFKEKNLLYEKDGAVWLKLSEIGNEQDKVIVKSSGEPTYRLPDIAYHITKFERGFDLIVDLFGSDHNATYPDVLAACKTLGYDTNKVKVLIHQFVTIMEKGEVVKMSTRKANFITLDELIDQTSSDVVRYFFNMRSMQSHLNFDLDLAKKHSDENPVFYLQYAHARISSIIRTVVEKNIKANFDNLKLLNSQTEIELIKKLHQFPDEMLYAAELYEPHRVCNYLEELAGMFHRFYNECRIIGSEKELAEARLALIIAVKITLRNGLKLLKIDAPERM